MRPVGKDLLAITYCLAQWSVAHHPTPHPPSIHPPVDDDSPCLELRVGGQ